MFGRRIRAIRAGVVFDGTGAPPARHGLVVLDELGRICYVGRAEGGAAALAGVAAEAVLDAPEATLLPGLIDSHVHLTFGVSDAACTARPDAPLMPLVEQIRADGEAERMLRATEAARAALAAGVTTLRDVGAAGRSTHALRALVASGAVIGPRVLVSGTPITTSGGHCWWLGGEADSPSEVLSLVRSLVRDGADGVKMMATGGGMTPGSNRLRAQFPVETLAAAVEDAHRLGRRVSAHAHGLEGIAHCAAAGIDMIEHCSWETAYGPHLDEAVAERLVMSGTYLGDTIGGGASIQAKHGVALEDLPDGQRRRVAIFRRLRGMGARVVTSSDAMYPVTPFEQFPWAVISAAIYGDITPEAAIHSATGLAAESISLDRETGTLEAGKSGDLLLVDGDVGEDVRNLARTRWVLRGGQIVAGGGAVWSAGRY